MSYFMTSDPEELEYMQIISEQDKEKVKANPKLRVHKMYKLGEVVANNVKYWGQKQITSKKATYLFICPYCQNTWRTTLSEVIDGKSKSCCKAHTPKKGKNSEKKEN